ASVAAQEQQAGSAEQEQQQQQQQQQQPPPPQQPQAGSRTELIEQQEAQKATALTPSQPSKAETYVHRYSEAFLGGQIHWHPFFHNSYSGGGFTLGAGYKTFVSPYNTLDLRGSWTFLGYKRIEAEYIAPHLFNRRGVLTAVGGWREATEVAFFGFGIDSKEA